MVIKIYPETLYEEVWMTSKKHETSGQNWNIHNVIDKEYTIRMTQIQSKIYNITLKIQKIIG